MLPKNHSNWRVLPAVAAVGKWETRRVFQGRGATDFSTAPVARRCGSLEFLDPALKQRTLSELADAIREEGHGNWKVFDYLAKGSRECSEVNWTELAVVRKVVSVIVALTRLSHELSATAPDPSASAAFYGAFPRLIRREERAATRPARGTRRSSDGVSDSSRRKPVRKAG